MNKRADIWPKRMHWLWMMLLGFLGIFAYWSFFGQSSLKNYEKVENGMTESQVESLFGKKGKLLGADGIMVGGSAYLPGPFKVWRGAQGKLTVRFDDEGKVVWCAYTKYPFWNQVTELLGLN